LAERQPQLGSGRGALIAYLRENLIGSALFGQTAAQEIEADLDRLGKFEDPETSEAPYDRLNDRVIEWCHAHPEPVPHIPNPQGTSDAAPRQPSAPVSSQPTTCCFGVIYK
jgi:hypothetical protein